MPGLVEGKAGLVTGSAGGIGRATALALAREGAAGVLVTDLPSRREDGEETVRLLEQEGGHAVFVAADVSVAADCEALVRHTVDAFGHLDFAHNNAGVELQATVVDTEEADWERVIAVNLKGVWLGMKYQIPQMLAARPRLDRQHRLAGRAHGRPVRWRPTSPASTASSASPAPPPSRSPTTASASTACARPRSARR